MFPSELGYRQNPFAFFFFKILLDKSFQVAVVNYTELAYDLKSVY